MLGKMQIQPDEQAHGLGMTNIYIAKHTDSTVAPLQNPAIFFNERFMDAARHEEGCYEKKTLQVCLFSCANRNIQR